MAAQSTLIALYMISRRPSGNIGSLDGTSRYYLSSSTESRTVDLRNQTVHIIDVEEVGSTGSMIQCLKSFSMNALSIEVVQLSELDK